MTPREIILANIAHESSPRCGLTFDRGRSDTLGCGVAHGYQQKRWVEGKLEYYDEWGNLWVRMREGSLKGEIFRPAIEGGGAARRSASSELQSP